MLEFDITPYAFNASYIRGITSLTSGQHLYLYQKDDELLIGVMNFDLNGQLYTYSCEGK